MLSNFVQSSARQREIVEIVFRNGWDYMRRLLTAGKADDEPKLPPPAVLRNILIDLGPVYVKLGQLLSTRPDILPPEYIEELTALQAEVPPVPWDEIEILIRQQIRQPLEEVFQTLNPQPVAAGSIAQTHRATLADGREVALKVQRPGLEEVVEQDIALLKGLAELVSITDIGQAQDLMGLADEFGNALRAELDFAKEATYTDRLSRNLSKSRWYDPKKLKIPEVFWNLTTEKLLAIEWLDGDPILLADYTGQEHGGDSEAQKKELVTLLTRVFFQQICLDGFFHADPHPGNLFYLKNGQVALLDCGMIGRMDPRTQQLLIEMLLAMVNLDAQRCSQLSVEMAGVSSKRVNLANLESGYDRLLRRYYNLSLSELSFSQMFYEVLQVSRENNLRLPSNMGLCAKAIANLEGIARTLDPEYNFAEQIKPLMTDLFGRQLVGEAPLQGLLRTALDLKNLSLQSPRQLEVFLDRVTTETLQWNIAVSGLDGLRRTMDDAANRLSFSVLVGSLIMGAAMISSQTEISQVYWVSDVLFAAASIVGLWLIFSILRSGRLR
ncbi:ABC1 kinase family protein [Oxynema aestuarii]|jgi:ubiquinone biosynthesis protein|uniref:AarF/ABC1/UbiB kinase family protein n=1 Tax=Oxynema aestuarii AP17 TaxID=2064643 RepID=A0A6H1TW58_9CYAN|nr:AarF/ABC1/UbiB kinase family protein [Oxynema aestuarii]QIZ70685.1 AarF/ABC1/UbiB kinase family protein [Oxynema aestuarii AP17]RMH77022.1 MAG: AarF/ABC1/UbiB kinase family protein [Cyanobacteria bacterium J007]